MELNVPVRQRFSYGLKGVNSSCIQVVDTFCVNNDGTYLFTFFLTFLDNKVFYKLSIIKRERCIEAEYEDFFDGSCRRIFRYIPECPRPLHMPQNSNIRPARSI